MPRLSVLIEDFADRFSFERAKVNGLARTMREAGLLTSGARGVNAPPATAMDAARLLLAMMLNSTPPSVVEDVRIVGQFTVFHDSLPSTGFAPRTLEDGLAGLIQFTGTVSDDRLDDINVMEFGVLPYRAIGSITIGQIREAEAGEEATEYGTVEKFREINFSHPDVDPSDITNLPESYHAAARRFPTGFYQEPKLQKDELVFVGKLVMGADA